MSRDPYEPQSKVSDKRPSARYALLWKGYFIFSVYAAVMTSLYVPTIPDLSYFDVVDFGVSLLSVVGLYGFTYSVRISKVVFWRYFFYFALIESLVFCLFLPLAGASRYGREFQFDPFYLFELGYVIPMLYALNAYAYKRPALWKKAR